jgi:hypothetical protein
MRLLLDDTNSFTPSEVSIQCIGTNPPAYITVNDEIIVQCESKSNLNNLLRMISKRASSMKTEEYTLDNLSFFDCV